MRKAYSSMSFSSDEGSGGGSMLLAEAFFSSLFFWCRMERYSVYLSGLAPFDHTDK